MKRASLYIMIVFYALAGLNHFVSPGTYMGIMPVWLPYHGPLVFISGIAEMLLALLLVFPATRKMAAWGIILLLAAVFPANIQMAVTCLERHDPYAWIAVARLPFQLVLVAWAWMFTRNEEK